MPDVHFITVNSAQSVGDSPTPEAQIHITGELPEYASLEAQDRRCDEQARELERALVHSLPGATYDRLLGLMLARRASHFRVPLETEER